jgi:hypothetical protein
VRFTNSRESLQGRGCSNDDDYDGSRSAAPLLQTLQQWFQQHQRRTALLRNALQWRDMLNQFRANQFTPAKAWDQDLAEGFADMNKTFGELKNHALSTVDHFGQENTAAGAHTVDAATDILNAKLKSAARSVRGGVTLASGKFHPMSRMFEVRPTELHWRRHYA